MKCKSHAQLGNYLVRQYMDDASTLQIRAFLIGCVEPDKNPTTYLKGSLRCQWLRGHNWGNAQRYMQRITRRLERRRKMRLWDFYSLGKLVHYITDAFTYAHNEEFNSNLKDHQAYEQKLQTYFLWYLNVLPAVRFRCGTSLMNTIRYHHSSYLRHPISIYTDARFSVTVCCCILAMLFPNYMTEMKYYKKSK